MTHTNFHRIIFAGALFVALSSSALAAKISIRADEWYPFNGNPARGKTGYMIDIAKKVAASTGHEIDYQVLDWDASIEAARNGKIDCIVGASKADAPEFNFPSEPLGMMTNAVFALKKNNLKLDSVAAFGKYRVGTVKDYSYGPEMDKFIADNPAQIKAVAAHSRPVVINMLRLFRGEIDLVVEEQSVGTAFLATLGIEESIGVAGHVTKPDPLFIACAPKSAAGKELVDALGPSIKAMRQNGELDILLKKYSLTDWVK